MTVLLGLPRDERALAALHLAALLARSARGELVVCGVLPRSWPAGPARVDAEYQRYLEQDAGRVLDAARGVLATLLPRDRVRFETVRARTVPAGLLEATARHGAELLVVGSSTSGGIGRVTLGGVADHLLHTAPVPVALAPRGFRTRPATTVTRVTAAWAPAGGSGHTVGEADRLARRFGAGLRLASFAVRRGPVVTAGVGLDAEADVLAQWSREIEREQLQSLRALAADGRDTGRDGVRGGPGAGEPPGREQAIGHGRDWREAVEDLGWAEGELLAVGSSSTGPLATVFLGSRASKIVRNSPVPVVALPRG